MKLLFATFDVPNVGHTNLCFKSINLIALEAYNLLFVICSIFFGVAYLTINRYGTKLSITSVSCLLLDLYFIIILHLKLY